MMKEGLMMSLLVRASARSKPLPCPLDRPLDVSSPISPWSFLSKQSFNFSKNFTRIVGVEPPYCTLRPSSCSPLNRAYCARLGMTGN
eukprot:COSAG02_NODE_1051_length_14956_cov_3.414216_7_plen_87_part_00